MTARGRSKAKPVPPTPTAVLSGGLNINQELFCRYYTQHNKDLFGNATQAYSEAYGYKLEELPDNDRKWGTRQGKDGNPEEYLVELSTREKAYNVCSVEGHRLLRNPKVLERITKLLNELLTDDVVDAELLRVILQNDDLGPKVRAIQEFNRLRQRITDKVDLTSGGKTLDDIIAAASHERRKRTKAAGN